MKDQEEEEQNLLIVILNLMNLLKKFHMILKEKEIDGMVMNQKWKKEDFMSLKNIKN